MQIPIEAQFHQPRKRHSRTWERNKKVCLFIANQERGKMFGCVVCNRGSKKYRCRAKAILRYHVSQTLHYLQGISVCNAGSGGLMILVEIRLTLFLHWVVSDHDWKFMLQCVHGPKTISSDLHLQCIQRDHCAWGLFSPGLVTSALKFCCASVNFVVF